MKILIAPDKFKGALHAHEVAENIAKGLRDVLPDTKIDIVPMADGGEGTAEVICGAQACTWLQCKAHDPLGREIGARYAWIEDAKLAVMEMSEAAGMRRLTQSERDPLRANTFGTGEMILDAANRGAKVRPGFDVVAETDALTATIQDGDVVITGEGSLDRQTLEGKTPAGVAQLARKLGKRIFAMVGRASDDAEVQKLFEGVFQNARSGMSQEENMKRAAELLRENARELARTVAAVCDRRSNMRRP